MTTDFTIAGGGTVYLLCPNTEAAHDWIADNIGEHQSLGKNVAVEHRYISNIVDGIRGDGLTVQ